ncbi:MAG: hypothetical protein LBE27_02675 [Deltaproteobacteria bacterium]|nr:hypothetical protein [Deltaproteobacteria bacterium]
MTLVKYHENPHANSIVAFFFTLSLFVSFFVFFPEKFSLPASIGDHRALSLPLLRLFLLAIPFIYLEAEADYNYSAVTSPKKSFFIKGLCIFLISVISVAITAASFNYPDYYHSSYPEISSRTFAAVIVFALIALYLSLYKSPFLTFVFLCALFCAFFSFLISIFWAVSIKYKPAVYLGVLIISYTVILAYILVVLSAIFRSIFFRLSSGDNMVSKIIGHILKERHVTSIFFGFVLAVSTFLLLLDFGQPKLFNFEYTGELTTIHIDYYTMIVPLSSTLLSPRQFRLSFPEGDLFFSEEKLSPRSYMGLSLFRFFEQTGSHREAPKFSGYMNGGHFNFFANVEGRQLDFRLELSFPERLMVFKHSSNFIRPIAELDGNLFHKKSAFDSFLDPFASYKIFWFMASVSKVMDYYHFNPTSVNGDKGNYRTTHGVIMTENNPPFVIASVSIILDFPGEGHLKIRAHDKLTPSRKIYPQLADSLCATLRGILYGYRQASYVSSIPSSGSAGHEEVSIQIPFYDRGRPISLNTYATANFLTNTMQAQNISLSLSSTARSQEELALQLSLWRLVCHTLKFHNTVQVHPGHKREASHIFKIFKDSFFIT